MTSRMTTRCSTNWTTTEIFTVKSLNFVTRKGCWRDLMMYLNRNKAVKIMSTWIDAQLKISSEDRSPRNKINLETRCLQFSTMSFYDRVKPKQYPGQIGKHYSNERTTSRYLSQRKKAPTSFHTVEHSRMTHELTSPRD